MVLLLGTILLTLYYNIVLFGNVWKLCMGINISVQYNGGFLLDIILLTQGYYQWGTRLNNMQWLCIYSLCNVRSMLLLHCLMVYYIVSGLFLLFFWCPCMASNVSVQYNGGFLPDIILLTQCLLLSGNPFKCHEEVLYFQLLLIPPKRFDIFPP